MCMCGTRSEAKLGQSLSITNLCQQCRNRSPEQVATARVLSGKLHLSQPSGYCYVVITTKHFQQTSLHQEDLARKGNVSAPLAIAYNNALAIAIATTPMVQVYLRCPSKMRSKLASR
jgi:hypothetical protein